MVSLLSTTTCTPARGPHGPESSSLSPAREAPTASQRLGHWWFRVKPVFPDAERSPLGGTWTSPAVRVGSHSFSINRTSAAYVIVSVFFLFIYGLICFSPLFFSIVTVFGAFGSVPTPNHLSWWLQFLTSVSRIFRPASSEALPPRTFIPSLVISCPGFVLFVFSGFIVGEPTPYLFVGFSTSSSFWIRPEVERILPCNLFPQSIRKKKKRTIYACMCREGYVIGLILNIYLCIYNFFFA